MRLGELAKTSKQRTTITRSIIVMVVVVAAASCSMLLTRHASPRTINNLPATVAANVHAFTPYGLNVLDGFTVNSRSVSYSQNVLIFQLQNSVGQTIAVTEQLASDAIASGVDPNATKVAGVDGTGFIVYNGTQTTGALFSRTHHGQQTMVLLNTTAPLPQSTVQDLLRGLRPITN